jgi:hypothetical protein
MMSPFMSNWGFERIQPMMSVKSRRFCYLIFCAVFVLTTLSSSWAMEGDAVVDEDGDIFVVVNGQPAQGKLAEAEEMPTIMFSAEQNGPHQIKIADMSSAPTMMVVFDSNGTEVGRNLQGENFETLKDFLDCDLKQGQLYILAAVPMTGACVTVSMPSGTKTGT